MATVTIILTDSDDGETVDVKVEFGDGLDNDSAAHHMAAAMLATATGGGNG